MAEVREREKIGVLQRSLCRAAPGAPRGCRCDEEGRE